MLDWVRKDLKNTLFGNRIYEPAQSQGNPSKNARFRGACKTWLGITCNLRANNPVYFADLAREIQSFKKDLLL